MTPRASSNSSRAKSTVRSPTTIDGWDDLSKEPPRRGVRKISAEYRPGFGTQRKHYSIIVWPGIANLFTGDPKGGQCKAGFHDAPGYSYRPKCLSFQLFPHRGG